ncbi:MAG: glutamine--fructose-6-phosphate transaminase (isomerizing) [Verrucomicrobiae bacterium]|nr:glutamine--fructose-6-phosphate transaminase (isomerizing) [Verrucomicrobiae bacterium]
MCGIVGYVGPKEAVPILLEGLSRLEYRGYDSAGMATLENGKLSLRKSLGRIDHLRKLVREQPIGGHIGISHTRWATHGKVTVANAHPHLDASGKLALVHNGVIENDARLKTQLKEEGHVFHSETDTEVLTHLIGREFDLATEKTEESFIAAVRRALHLAKGTYGIALVHEDLPGLIIGARRGSPLVLGIGEGENFLASDASAIVAHTKNVVYLKDNEIVSLTAESFTISTLEGNGAHYNVTTVEDLLQESDKGEYPHYMLKEIFEQTRTVQEAMRGRLSIDEATAKLGGLEMSNSELRSIERIVLTGCGTAMHAAMVGEYLIESLAQVPTECEFASEFRYRNLPMTKDTLVFALSQSGETADTLAALRESQRKGHRTLGICNNVASTIARESNGGVYMHAGPEIGVAATKSFTSQVMVLTLIALLLGRIRNLSSMQGTQIIYELEALPEKIAATLKLDKEIEKIAQRYAQSSVMLFMGRQFNYPIALEAALKLKEISYIAASGHPSAELKHGVIALINEETPSVFIAPNDGVYTKNLSSIQEVRARSGPVIAIGTEGCSEELEQISNDLILIPKAPDYLTPILSVIPLQLLAYHIAVARGCDVDKPRNLAKSVTVE